MKKKLIIIGTSKTASQVYDFVQQHQLFDIMGFAVHKQYRLSDTFYGTNVYNIEELDNHFDKENLLLYIAISWNRLNADRKNLYLNLKKQGYSFANIISPTALIYGEILGDNNWIHDYVSVYTGATIDSNNILLTNALVGSFTTLGSHIFCGVKSSILGGCKIGDQVFIGTNAIVFDDRSVGNKCLVGAGTMVKRDLPNYSLIKTSTVEYAIESYTEDEIEGKLLFAKNIK